MEFVPHVFAQLPGRAPHRYDFPKRIESGETSYEVKAHTAGGGNSAVFLAQMYASGKFVRQAALKILKQLDRVRSDRFQNEVRLIKDFDHPRIAKFYGVGTVEGTPWFDPDSDRDWSVPNEPIELPWVAMGLGGNNLRRLVETSGPLKADVLKVAAIDMCDALGYVHGRGVIHRDVKPENFVVDGSRAAHVLMIDFGIAKYLGDDVAARPFDNITKQNEFVGPQAFCSPELLGYARDKRTVVDTRSDLFQLGKVLWFVATGRVSAGIPSKRLDPFQGALHAIVSNLLCDDPEDRMGSVSEVQGAIEKL